MEDRKRITSEYNKQKRIVLLPGMLPFNVETSATAVIVVEVELV